MYSKEGKGHGTGECFYFKKLKLDFNCFYLKPFTFEYLPVGDEIPVIIVDNSLLEHGCFSCCLEKNAGVIERISKKAQIYADKDPHPYVPM